MERVDSELKPYHSLLDMSTAHHGSPEQHEIKRRLLDQFLQRAGGKLHKSDEGELAFAIAHDTRNQIVVIKFGKPVDWIGLPKKEALQLANLLIEHAAELK